MNVPTTAQEIRAAYAASSYALALSASRAYVRTLAEHQDAALAGDPRALRAVSEALALFAITAPELAEQQYADPEQRRMTARRSIA
ncbi:hypothetical protein PV728_32005 [Streptomyces europaeiscabiei]|uniref:hypothetical protein n=1 Tax=Streptomyces europaeiscabiei TaxID=146819 RepID=UPI0029AB5025|nr:hypothetical protein [Streptomyces europaeiscabiei]MDX3634802.1 hypothetical protein [Streptomyces europaeiscabiei]MDX3652758.1 hypothetical protein [Streptomyces europaeiscabiei]